MLNFFPRITTFLVLLFLLPLATTGQTNDTTTTPPIVSPGPTTFNATSLASNAPTTQAAPTTNQTTEDGPLIVGFLYVSNPKDFGWVYQFYFAQAEIEDLYGKSKLKVLFQYDVGASNYTYFATDMIAKGAKMIMTSSSLETLQVNLSRAYPNVKFVTTPGSTVSKNLATTVHNGYQAFFMGGVMAAHLSKTRKAGFMAGNWLTSTIKAADAFLLGARTVDPSFLLYVIRIPNTLDFLRNRRAVELLIQEHDCDVFTGITVTSAITETAVRNQKLSFGYPSDGRLLFGERIYSGCQLEWFTTYRYFVNAMMNNTWKANFSLSYGMQEGAVALSHLSSLVSAEVEESVKNWTQAVSSGRYCMFNRYVAAFKNFYNSTQFNNDGCLLNSLVATTTVLVDGIKNLGFMTDEQVFEKIYVRWDSSGGVALTTIIVVFDVLMFVCLALVVAFKGTMIIVATNFYFCVSVLGGALLGYSGLFFWIGEPDDSICAARIWFLSLSFFFIFGAIAGKTYKMWRIWSNPNIAEDGRSSIALNLFLLTYSLIMIVLLALITGLGGYVSANIFDSSLEYNQYFVTCKLTDSGIIILSLLLGVCGVITFLASVLAFLSRNVHKKFNETSSIVLSIYNILIAEAVVVLLFLNTNSSDPRNHLIFISCGTFIAITCPILYMFLPKLYVLVKDYSVSKASSMHNSNSNSFSKNVSLPN